MQETLMSEGKDMFFGHKKQLEKCASALRHLNLHCRVMLSKN